MSSFQTRPQNSLKYLQYLSEVQHSAQCPLLFYFFSSVSPLVALLMKESQKDASGYLSLLASILPPSARPPVSPLSTSLPPQLRYICLTLVHRCTFGRVTDSACLCASLSPS